MTSLNNINDNETVCLKKVESGKKLSSYLSSIGIYLNTRFKVLRNLKRGPVIIKVNNSNLTLGNGIARKLIVEKINNTEVKKSVH